MPIQIKTKEEIQILKEGGKILASILENIKNYVKEGQTTKEIDDYAETLFKKYNVIPSFKGYQGFPASICTSVNEEIVHSIPCNRILKNGDILTVDAGVFHKKMHTDSAITIFIGDVDEKTREFVFVVRKALYEALDRIKEGTYINIIGETVQKYIEEKHGYSIVKELTGHGVGRKLHEDPYICNYKENSKGPLLQAGMVLAIEPIANMGSPRILTLKDNWTIVTYDKLPSCQWEHTVLVTKNGCEILTQL